MTLDALLPALALSYPHIDPVAVELGPLVIRWYALAYIAGIVLGFSYISHINRRETPPLLSKKALDDMMLYAVLGIILGGRLGYVLFYKAGYYLHHPLEIAYIWQGGMAFHGGFLGVVFAFWLFAKRYNISWLSVMDRVAAAAPIGLFFGRIANFINGELWGRPAPDLPWAMVFPTGGPVPRHPSQLYEAALEGLLLFVIIVCLVRYTKSLQKPGLISGVFLIGYGLSRSIVEFFREPDAHLGFILGPLTMGQLLSVPMIALGVYVIITAHKRAA